MKLKRIMALILCFAMVLSTMSFSVFAEGSTATDTPVATINGVGYETLEEAFATAVKGQTITLEADATPILTSQRAITEAAVIDLNGKTLTLTEDDLYFGTTTFKNGTIAVDPSVKASTAVFWMFADQTLTFNGVDIIATGVTGTYLIGINGGTGSAVNLFESSITIENTAVASLTAVICDNGTGNSIVIENSKLDVASIDGRAYLGGQGGSFTVKDSDIDLNGVKEGFYIRADQTLLIEGNSTVDIILNSDEGRYGINVTDATATYTKADTATVNATVNAPAPGYVATVNGTKYTDIQEAIKAAAPGGTVEITNDIVVDEWIMFAESLSIGNGNLITLVIDGLEINGNGYSLTVNSIESAGNGGRLFYDATNLNIKDLTINYAEGVAGGIGLKSGTIDNVTFNGGGYGVLPGGGDVTINNCTFATNADAIYSEQARDNLKVTNNTFNQPEGVNVILIRGNTVFTGNTVNSGRTVNVVSGSPVVKGNNFNDVRFKVYNVATATIGDNVINVLTFNDDSEVKSTFDENTLSEDATQVLISAGVIEKPVLSGSGTEEDPYLIENLDDLIWFRDKVDEQSVDGTTQFAGKYFKLTADINLEGINWNPIGSMSGDHGSFKGVFDGGEHTISNLYVEAPGNGLGLFARTTDNAEIKNLTINNVTLKSTDNSNYLGSVVANSYASTKITNVNVTGKVDISGRGYIGGISGHGYVVMDNCSVKAEGTITSTFWCVGGILGYGGEGATNITNSSVEGIGTGLVLTSAAGGIGSIIGMAEDNDGKQPISGSNLSAKNIKIETYTGAYGDSYASYALGYLYGGNPTSVLTGTLSVENVAIKTSTGDTNPPVSDAVAAIGSAIYFDLQSAIDAVEEDETITVLRDVTITTPAYGENALNYAKAVNCTIDLNGNTVSADTGNSVLRFNIANSGATSDVTVTVKNGKVVSGANTWCALMASGIDGAKAILNIENVKVENSKAGDFAVKAWGNSVINAKNVDITSSYGGGFYAVGGEIVLDDCTTVQTGLHTAPYLSMAFGVSNNGKMTIKSGDYSAAPAAIADGNNQGQSHGSWVGGIMNSGGTLIINGGTFANDNFGDNSLATAARGLICVDTGAILEINGGTFNALKGIIDYQNNLGDALKNPVTVIKGGTYSANPESDWVKVAEGFVVKANEDGTYGVQKNANLILTIDELKAFRDAVNAGNTYKGVTVKLGADIDLAGEEWTPIGNSTNKFQGTFDGQNHTISNLVITGNKSDVGLFGFTTDGEVKNLTVNHAKISGRLNVGVVAGTPYTSKYTNIAVTGHVEVNGMSYVGGVFGKNVYADVTGVTVDVDETSYVKATSTENGTAYRSYVGGVIGFMGEGGHTVSNVTSNINVTGDVCDIGGIVGIAHYGNNFKNIICTATVTNTNQDAADAAETGGIAGVWHNGGVDVTFEEVYFDGKVVATGVAENTLIGAAYSASGSGDKTVENEKVAKIGTTKYDTLSNAISAAQSGDTVVIIADGTYALPAFDKNITIEAAGGIEAIFTVNKTKVTEATFNNVTFKYATTSSYNGIQHSTKLTYNNCTFEGQIFLYAAEEIFNNCTFNTTDANNYNVWTYGAAKVDFNNCTFNSAGKSVLVYNEGATATDLTVEGCTFTASQAVEGKAAIEIDTTAMPDGTDIVIKNSTATGFAAGSVSGNSLWNDKKDQRDLTVTVDSAQVWPLVAKIGEAGYATLQAALDAAKGTDDVVIDLVADATLDITAWQTLAIGGDNAKTITINGNNKTLTFNKLNSDWNHVATANDAKLILNDMTIADSGYNNGPWNRYDLNFACDVEFNNVKAVKAIAVKGDATFNNVTINETGDNYAIWVQPNGQKIAINGLTVTSAGRGIKIDDQYVDAPQKVELTIANASFETLKKAAILVKNKAGADIIAGENIDILKVTADTVNLVWVDSDAASTYDIVNVAGASKWLEDGKLVAMIGTNVYFSLQSAVDAAQAGETVTLLADVTEDVTISKNITLDGASFKYTGKMTLKKVNVTIQNVNFVKGQIYKNKNTGASGNYTIKNCNFDGQGLNDYAVNLGGTYAINIEDCTATGYGYGFLQVPASNNSVAVKNVQVSDVNYGFKIDYSNGVTLEDVTVTDAKAAGIYDSNFGKKTYTIKNCNITGASPIKIWKRNETTYDTFNFVGNNSFGTTEFTVSDYAILKLADADATLVACEGLNVRTGLEGYVVEYVDDTYSLSTPVAKIGEVSYTTLQEALAAVTSGATVDILDDITITEAWDNRYTGAKITVPVTINGNGHTIKFTGAVADAGNYHAAFRFESDATVKNLTIDMSEATTTNNRLRAISSKGDLTVDNCNFIGNTNYTNTRAVIFGEGSGSAIGEVDVKITNSTFTNWTKRGITDNENAQDAGTVEITGNTFTNSNVAVSAKISVIFTGNTMDNSWVNITSYASDSLDVVAKDNTLAENDLASGNVNSISAYATVNAQEGFLLPVAMIGTNVYFSLQSAFNGAGEGDVVTLVSNMALAESVVVAADDVIILDLAGYTITGTDTTDKNFGLININKGNLTIKDSSAEGTGAITLTATVNSGWKRYSAVVANNQGTLTVESGKIEHLGGTDMAYAIDNLTNGNIGDAVAVINGGTINSSYRGIRQFANSTTCTNSLTIEGGTVGGTNKAVWLQSSNTKANKAELIITGGAVGDVYVSSPADADVTELKLSANAANVANVINGLTSGYTVEKVNGVWIISKAVASLTDAEGNVTNYSSLAAAVAAAELTGGTVALLEDIEVDDILKINGTKKVTINGNGYTVTGSAKKTFEVHNTTAVFNNIKIINTAAYGRCIDTRVDNVHVTVKDAYLEALGVNSQPITVGGDNTNPDRTAHVSVQNSTITAGNSGYGIIVFQEGAEVNITNTQITGYAALYLKPESKGSTVTVGGKSVLTGNNYNNSATNTFGTVVFETSDVKMSVAPYATINANNYGDQAQNAFELSGNLNTITMEGKVITNGNNAFVLGGFVYDANYPITVADGLVDALRAEGYTVESNIVTGIKNITLTTDSVKVRGITAIGKTGTLVLSSYDADGRLTDVKLIEVTSDTVIKLADTGLEISDTVKASLLDSMSTMTPLCEAASIEIE